MKTENVERLASLYSKRTKLNAAISKLEVVVAAEAAAAFQKKQERKIEREAGESNGPL
jgi:hypothetical protein